MPYFAHFLNRAFFRTTAVIAVVWAVALDLLVAAAWIHPIACALALAPATLLVVCSLTPLCRTQGSTKWVALAALSLSALVIAVPWNQRKRFVTDLYSVRHGMSVDEVEALMVAYIRGAGARWDDPESPSRLVRGLSDPQDSRRTTWPRATLDPYREPNHLTGEASLQATGAVIYRWSSDVNYNADWGLVEFVNGKVVRVEFLPD